MTSIIHFTPISGAFDQEPPCYLLQIDEFCFLLDCGWDESFDIDYINKLKDYIPTIDAVLLSHPDTNHLGALPYLVGKCGLSCEVYATIPVYQMGQMFAYDLYQSHRNYEEFDLFTLDDVDNAFDKVVQVKYNQTVSLKGKGQGLTVTPLPAGHMLGGTIWRIIKDGGEDIIYAMDFNHKKERHLNGCLLDKITRPSLLITDCLSVDYVPERRRKRDEQLMENMLKTLRSSGNVLIAADTAGRVLELSHMLEQMWRGETALHAYSLVLMNHFSYNVIEFAKSMVEWMSDKLMRSFEGQRNNPFAFRYLQLCHNLTELSRIQEPRVILASQPDMESGFSRELFFNFASNPKNMIIVTQRPAAGTLAERLLGVKPDLDSKKTPIIQVEKKFRVQLTGKELEDYLEAKREEALEKERLNNEESAKKIKDDEESEESEDEADYFDDVDPDETENDPESKQTKTEPSAPTVATPLANATVKHDLLVTLRQDGGRVKGGGFFKNAKKSYPMFPCPERKAKWDEYGEFINYDDFSIFDMSRLSNPMLMDTDKEFPGDIGNADSMVAMGTGQNGQLIPTGVEVTPTKCEISVEDVQIKARIEFIDFEGRSDGESLKKIIAMIKPRRLILVRGKQERIQSLASYCVSSEYVTQDRIFTPKALETVDATTERHIYQVKLRDALVSSLHFSDAKDGVQLAWVEAEILMTNAESLMPQSEDAPLALAGSQEDNNNNSNNQDTDSKKQVEEESEEKNDKEGLIVASRSQLMPALQQLPQSRLPPHQTIFVNELKLSDFKQTLMKHGVQAEFSGGVLICNGQVEVKRTESGRIHLEGTICEDYFKVRQLLYQQYAIL